jgi:hypothetical protein
MLLRAPQLKMFRVKSYEENLQFRTRLFETSHG